MHSFKSSKISPYSMELIKEIILDVESYPFFLPWCTAATIISHSHETIVAKLDISFKSFTESYVSEVLVEEKDGEVKIHSKAISGPFDHLNSTWHIEKKNNSTQINFSIDFKLKSKILDIVIGAIFYKAVEKMVTAFENRAKELNKTNLLPI